MPDRLLVKSGIAIAPWSLSWVAGSDFLIVQLTVCLCHHAGSPCSSFELPETRRHVSKNVLHTGHALGQPLGTRAFLIIKDHVDGRDLAAGGCLELGSLEALASPQARSSSFLTVGLLQAATVPSLYKTF